MSLSYIERFALVEDAAFRKRLQFAVWSAAVDILNEASPSNSRKQWAVNALKGVADDDVMRRVAIRCAANPTIGAAGKDATDSDIQYVVSGIVNTLAGA